MNNKKLKLYIKWGEIKTDIWSHFNCRSFKLSKFRTNINRL